MRNIIVFDIDGVLLDCTHRLHYTQGEHKDWEKFFSEGEMRKDSPLPYLKLLRDVETQYSFSRTVALVATARPKSTRSITELMIRHEADYMRDNGDYRPDYVVKKEMLNKIGAENILFWIDDSPAVCDMLRANGVDVLQVGGQKK